MTASLNAKKLKFLADIAGMTTMDFLEMAVSDSIVPGICTNADCNFICNVEPDQDEGFCEHCKTNTVESALVLAGII